MREDLPKIANATYKLLDFFPSNDSLTHKAREKVFAILDSWGIISIAYGSSIQKEKATLQILIDIGVLETYLQMADYRGWLNHISFLILKKEYGKIKNEIILSSKVAGHHIIKSGKEVDDNILQKPMRENEVEISAKALGRQEKILQILSSKGRAQVADIVKEIPNITKRTVRRDLDYLLKKGEIIRMGEWNQVFYKIKDNTDGTKLLS